MLLMRYLSFRFFSDDTQNQNPLSSGDIVADKFEC